MISAKFSGNDITPSNMDQNLKIKFEFQRLQASPTLPSAPHKHEMAPFFRSLGSSGHKLNLERDAGLWQLNLQEWLMAEIVSSCGVYLLCRASCSRSFSGVGHLAEF